MAASAKPSPTARGRGCPPSLAPAGFPRTGGRQHSGRLRVKARQTHATPACDTPSPGTSPPWDMASRGRSRWPRRPPRSLAEPRHGSTSPRRPGHRDPPEHPLTQMLGWARIPSHQRTHTAAPPKPAKMTKTSGKNGRGSRTLPAQAPRPRPPPGAAAQQLPKASNRPRCISLAGEPGPYLAPANVLHPRRAGVYRRPCGRAGQRGAGSVRSSRGRQP